MASTIDYSRIESDCLKNSAIVKRVLDDFLLYYVAAREKLDKKVDRLLRSHSSILMSCCIRMRALKPRRVLWNLLPGTRFPTCCCLPGRNSRSSIITTPG